MGQISRMRTKSIWSQKRKWTMSIRLWACDSSAFPLLWSSTSTSDQLLSLTKKEKKKQELSFSVLKASLSGLTMKQKKTSFTAILKKSYWVQHLAKKIRHICKINDPFCERRKKGAKRTFEALIRRNNMQVKHCQRHNGPKSKVLLPK